MTGSGRPPRKFQKKILDGLSVRLKIRLKCVLQLYCPYFTRMHRALHSTTAARGGGCLLWLGRSGVWIHAAPRGSTEPWSLLMTRRSWCNTHAWVRVAHPVGRAWSFPRNTCRAGGGGRGGRGQFVAHVRVRVHWTQWPRGRGNRTRSTTGTAQSC